MQAAEELSSTSGTLPACRALGVVRSTLYRHRRRLRHPRIQARAERASPRALAIQEQQAVLAELRSARFVDQAPAAVYAGLLDEGRYLCSERTMYRLLSAAGELRERRDQLRHPAPGRERSVARWWRRQGNLLRVPDSGSSSEAYVDGCLRPRAEPRLGGLVATQHWLR